MTKPTQVQPLKTCIARTNTLATFNIKNKRNLLMGKREVKR